MLFIFLADSKNNINYYITVNFTCPFTSVLFSARTGLIFARSQEGIQPGWLKQTDQTNGIFNTVCLHAVFWVGELAWGRLITTRGAC